jgi:hypothetical protein
LKIPYKFDFRLEFSDFEKIYFAITSEYGYLFMVFLIYFYNDYSLKLFWTRKGSFRGEPYLHLLNNRIFVARGFETYTTNIFQN